MVQKRGGNNGVSGTSRNEHLWPLSHLLGPSIETIETSSEKSFFQPAVTESDVGVQRMKTSLTR